MNYKINMSRGEALILEHDELEFLLTSAQQLVVYRQDNGKIEKTINKAHIVSIVPDTDSEEGISDRLALPEKEADRGAVIEELEAIKNKKPWSLGVAVSYLPNKLVSDEYIRYMSQTADK